MSGLSEEFVLVVPGQREPSCAASFPEVATARCCRGTAFSQLEYVWASRLSSEETGPAATIGV